MNPPSMDNVYLSSRRSRCISCSDSGVGSSFEDSSLLLDNTLLPRRSRTSSISERIKGDIQTGKVTYFCRSRGHGFLQGEGGEEHFVHVSDVESKPRRIWRWTGLWEGLTRPRQMCDIAIFVSYDIIRDKHNLFSSFYESMLLNL